ncbi:hypothetical protein GTC6_20230 [Gordonia terrae C-6]|uniref:Uncharacterized protein n=1 Tax=Gordonia terrae C-6 TaxID=1316928 RepID=R7Y4D5_9ACTN|nr:hypothetical protein GTC6_20230 [Gordonia terrae C-6]
MTASKISGVDRTPFSPGESWPVRVERLRHPLLRENGRLVAVTWEKAMDRVVARSRSLLEDHFRRCPGRT